MCSEALFSGKVTVKGDGVNEVLNFWSTVAASEKPETTLTTKWDASTATAETIMSDLRVVRRSMIKDGGFTPRDLICGTNVIDTILSKLTASKSLDMRRVDMGHIDPQHLPDGVTYWGYLKDSLLTFTPTMNGTRAMTVMLLWFRQINVCSQRRAQKPCWPMAPVQSSAKQIRESSLLRVLVFRCPGPALQPRWAESCRSPAVRYPSSSRFMLSTSSTPPDPNPMSKEGLRPLFHRS